MSCTESVETLLWLTFAYPLPLQIAVLFLIITIIAAINRSGNNG